ncbi:MAG TPA: TlpA disulfide reductase family protein [Bryobacteraceae bacterium]|nr:TlpA disulfide reductase family protein [Bryobacteraceae bacterium]
MTTALDGLVVPRLGDGMVRLRSLRGRVVVMSFWATWCAPCRAEMPILEMTDKSAARKNVSVLAITDEDESTVRRYIRQNGFSVPILIDRGRKIFDRYQVDALPVTKIFDGNGHLMAELTLISESALLAAVEEAHIPSATRAPR